MSKFKTQSLITIIAETGYAGLASATVKRILYKKPNGDTGYWIATNSGTTLVYSVQNGDIDQVGEWQFQAYIEVTSLKGYGSIAKQTFEKPII